MTNQPDIFVYGIRFQEPIIALTSFIVTAFCFIGYYKTRFAKKNSSIYLYRLFILFICISSFLGGLFGHAFLYKFGLGGKFSTWYTSMMAITFAQQAGIMRAKQFISDQFYKILSILNVLQLFIFMVVITFNPQFIFVEIHTAIGLLAIVTVVESYILSKNKCRISLNILTGIGMLVIAVSFIFSK